MPAVPNCNAESLELYSFVWRTGVVMRLLATGKGNPKQKKTGGWIGDKL
jgi:hypothetical protein